jgi:hypothetical protein
LCLSATDDDGSCTYAEANEDCEGNCTDCTDQYGFCVGLHDDGWQFLLWGRFR